ncbi:MgtC/SapB family protein [Oceanobacillus salinisoli]|uniref:MgtC/SapB family protein n=1 Tax=Oceanobacillus salinisoli TaxID=2678611 RepID=UPI0012E1EF37|nr:MgtC/SapB family protein [Oceanobacillus salinisoli]
MEYLNEILGEDFSIIAIRLIIALTLAGIIGFEREVNNHSAGFRTHILVGVGSCLMMLMSLYGFTEFIDNYNQVRFDPARIPSYVISGIGFLGAGTIIVYGGTIRGLTTAASIWTVAGLGLVVGMGMYGAAILATFIILISLMFLNNFERLFPKARTFYFIDFTIERSLEINRLINVLEKYNIKLKMIDISNIEENLRKVHVKLEHNQKMNHSILYEELSNIKGVINISEINK